MIIGNARDLTASDTAGDEFNWVMVTGAAGTLVYSEAGYIDTTVTIAPLNVWIPVGRATNIKTSSTATGFVVA